MPRALQFTDSVTPSHWYGDWKEHIEDYDTVILIDEVRGRDVFDYILSHNPSCNLCAFYDSPVRPGTPKEPSRYTDMPVHFYTCDRHIAEKYHATFAPYFYIFSPCDFDAYDALEQEAYQRDVFFIGEEKGDRRARIDDITKVLDQAGLTHELRLVPQNRHRSLFHRHNPAGVGYMPYSVVQERVRTSRAILELISDGQTGLTQRSFEALFLRKKLITNSPEIKSYDFYHPQTSSSWESVLWRSCPTSCTALSTPSQQKSYNNIRLPDGCSTSYARNARRFDAMLASISSRRANRLR